MPELVRHRITEASGDDARNAVATSLTDDGRLAVWTDTGEPAILTPAEAVRHLADVAETLIDLEEEPS
jgi:hypothetical protein